MTLASISFVWPTSPVGRISSSYGRRKAPKPGASTFHRGIDIAVAGGSAIIASASGKVVTSSYNSSRGKYMIIDHGGGLRTLYQHASKLNFSSGQTVKQGQRIGSVGKTGIATGNHLHFEVHKNGAPVNPLNYVSAGRTKVISVNNTSNTGSGSSGGNTKPGGASKTTDAEVTKSGTEEKVQVFHAQSKSSINKWGLLRYFEEIDTPSIGQNKANSLLQLYNRKSRSLTISDAFGDPNVRAGTLIPVKLDLGDVVTNNYMLVDKVTHKFTKDTHMMDLTLEGAWD